MIRKSIRIPAIFICLTCAAPHAPTAIPAVFLVTSSGQVHEFPLRKGPLEDNLKGMPLLEGGVAFQVNRPALLKDIPADLIDVEYTSVPLSADHSLLGVKGTDPQGNVRLFFDRDGNLDLTDEAPIEFTQRADMRVARIPLHFTVDLNGEDTLKRTGLILFERSPGRIDYHFNEIWEATLAFGGETLNVALQRWPILFIDSRYSGAYDRMFSTKAEVLALGGKFFRIHPDFLSEKLILEETDRAPVDQGFPAPDFTIPLWNSERTFRLTDQNDRLTVLTFWSPLCSGSRGEAPLFSGMAEEYISAPSVTFLAVTNDEVALAGYLKDHPHRFPHAVDPTLWEIYGVTAPFVTFLIDGDGMILKRYFRFSTEIAADIDRWLENRKQEKNSDASPPQRKSQCPARNEVRPQQSIEIK